MPKTKTKKKSQHADDRNRRTTRSKKQCKNASAACGMDDQVKNISEKHDTNVKLLTTVTNNRQSFGTPFQTESTENTTRSSTVSKADIKLQPLDSSDSESNISSPDATPVKRQYKCARFLSPDDESNDDSDDLQSIEPAAKKTQQKQPLDSSDSASNMTTPDATPVKRQYKCARILSSDDESNDASDDLQSIAAKTPHQKQSLDSSDSASNMSSSDDTPVKRQYKRARFLSSDDDSNDDSNDLQPMGNKDISQIENVGSIKAIKMARFFAQAKGQGTSHQSNSTTEGEKSPDKLFYNTFKKVKKKHRRWFADDDMNGGPGDEHWDDDGDNDGSSSDEEEVETTPVQKATILKFFNEAALSDLYSIRGCSNKRAKGIMDMRPFLSWKEMTERFAYAKYFNTQVVRECKRLLRIRSVVQQLMKKCEKISEEVESVISELTGKASIDNTDEGYISKQPKLLNDEMELTPYQIVGLNWLRVMHEQELNGILGDEMGLGKTIQTIAFFAQLKESGEPGPHLVVAPTSTLDNWLRELKLWCPSLKVLLYYGSLEERAYLRARILTNRHEDFDVAVTSYKTASCNHADRKFFKKVQWHYAIFDEGHMLKNMSSIRYKSLTEINADRRFLLTGTPLQNNLIELMSLLVFVMPELFTNKTVEDLKQIFTSMTGKLSDESRSAYEAESMGHIQRILKPFFLRRLKTEVLQQLPKKRDYVDHVPMTYEQQEIYERLRREYKEKVKEKSSLAGHSGASMMMSLRKAANHHLLLRTKYDLLKLREMAKAMLREPTHVESVEQFVFEDMEVMSDFELHQLCRNYRSVHKYQLSDDLIVESGKFSYLDEKLPELKSKGSRVLLFSQFVMMLDIIEVYLKIRKYTCMRLDGSTAVAERQCLIDKFNNDPDIFIFMLSTKAGGLGINLTAADTVILHDIDFNPYNDKQAEDRCHRLGQTRDVNVYRLISGNSIEEGMWKCAQGKLNLEQDVTGSSKDEKVDEKVDVASILQEALAVDSSSS